jgi:hypothetical protein
VDLSAASLVHDSERNGGKWGGLAMVAPRGERDGGGGGSAQLVIGERGTLAASNGQAQHWRAAVGRWVNKGH